jgi:hypothetical protein
MNEWLASNRGDLYFENTSVGRLKKTIWESAPSEVDRILADYGIPSPSERAKPGTYIQTTIHQ